MLVTATVTAKVMGLVDVVGLAVEGEKHWPNSKQHSSQKQTVLASCTIIKHKLTPPLSNKGVGIAPYQKIYQRRPNFTSLYTPHQENLFWSPYPDKTK